jgi:hypothetical protein
MAVGPCWGVAGCAIGKWGGEAGWAGYGRLGLALEKEKWASRWLAGLRQGKKKAGMSGKWPMTYYGYKNTFFNLQTYFPICKSF